MLLFVSRKIKSYNGIKDMYGYFRCIAAGHSGSPGVEVAISQSCPYAIEEDGTKISVEMEHASILFSDARGVIVRICNKSSDFDITSAPLFAVHH